MLFFLSVNLLNFIFDIMEIGVPVSWMMIAPSITPGRPNSPNNPGLRLYKFETSTGQVSI